MATGRQIEPARDVALIVNLRSRRGEAASRSALDELSQQGLRVRLCLWVRSGRGLPEAVRAAISNGLQTVVVGGGDGTISCVVDLFARRPDLTLGLLPLGTGNEVALGDKRWRGETALVVVVVGNSRFRVARDALRVLVPDAGD